jgi:YHS domain-containing protein
MAQQTDPVCGMQVDEQRAAGKSEHEGQTYYFCSAGCKTKFDQNPEQYVKKSEDATGA